MEKKNKDLVQGKINKFSSWILSFVPKPITKVVNERVELLKAEINKIYEKYR